MGAVVARHDIRTTHEEADVIMSQEMLVLVEGTSSQRTLVDIGATTKKHAEIVPYTLAVHALSGCGTVAYLFGIGKAKVLKTLLKGHKLVNRGNLTTDFDDILSEATSFMIACYGC